jgi:hypothetical protein
MNSPAPKTAVWFPAWPEALRDSRLPPLRRQQYRLALIRYLRFCKETRQWATVESARAFMETVQEQRLLSLAMVATWKEALNWFFKEAGNQSRLQTAPTNGGGEAGTQAETGRGYKPIPRGLCRRSVPTNNRMSGLCRNYSVTRTFRPLKSTRTC